jgi:hypothetical protein
MLFFCIRYLWRIIDVINEIREPTIKAIGAEIIIHWILLISSIMARTWKNMVAVIADNKMAIRSIF